MTSPAPHRRLRLDIQGAVQGVGFRPHVYRLARDRGLAGWIVNDSRGVRIEVEGPEAELQAFARSLREAPPRQARILEVEERWIPPRKEREFRIRESRNGGTPRASILPDLATCPACLEDIRRAGDRRAGYPFTNCTDCGPRFSIVVRLPYDRPHTTMAGFVQCPECRTEYTTPEDRRFHAQPNACPACGPRLRWWGAGEPELLGPGALQAAAESIRSGRIVAVLGLGGFHLVVDAASESAVSLLRERKGREGKPLAVMVRDLDDAARLVEVTPAAGELLSSSGAPIVLLPKRADLSLAPSVAPGNPRLGVMLAYTPLHHLLLEAVGRPVVATSGNRSEEPICIDPAEARTRLGDIADDFLVHDRPIQRHVDDSVARVGPEGPQLLRRARGYAPLPLPLPLAERPILALGGHLKNTIAVARDGRVWLSQHIGDLETPEARDALRATVRDFLELYRIEPAVVVHDLHPGYASTRYALDELAVAAPRLAVQHHHAHLAAGLAEHGADPDRRALGVVWDGTGYGTDGTIWGGEFLTGGLAEADRTGHLRSFRLPGGEAAVREPRRSALGLLTAAGLGDHEGARESLAAFSADEDRLLGQALSRGVNAPVTTSAGRLFDALASILGLAQRSSFEGDAAMRLEHAALQGFADGADGAYPMEWGPGPGSSRVLDWEPLLRSLLEDRRRKVPVPVSAARIHNGLVAGIVRVAAAVGQECVVLSGGCFQNTVLTRGAWQGLREAGHRVLLHRAVPPGDGGIALGQAAAAAARLAAGRIPEPDTLPPKNGA